jgi:16S rRNA processing protein RimM
MATQAIKMADQQICVGVITGAHGVQGFVRVKSFTATPEDVAAYGLLSDESGIQTFDLTLTGAAKGVLLARIAGANDRNAAEALRGVEMWVDRSKLPVADDDEFYHADLVGLAAVRPDGSAFGTVRALHDFGAGEMIEFDLNEGGNVILPFTHDVVPNIDIAAGQVVVNPPNAVDATREKTSGRDKTADDAEDESKGDGE